MPQRKPNILVLWGDDIGITNSSCYSDGVGLVPRQGLNDHGRAGHSR